MDVPSSCRDHAEGAIPREPSFREKLAAVLIQKTGWFGGRSLDERGDVFISVDLILNPFSC